MCFGTTPCGPGSGYAGVSCCLRFGLGRGRCSRYVVMGSGPVPVPVGVVSLRLLSSPPLRARLCWQCRASGPCTTGPLVPGARCIPSGWGLEGVRLVRVPGSLGCRGHRGRPGTVSPLGLLLLSDCSALQVPPGGSRPGAPAPSCPVFVLLAWSFLRAMYLGLEVPPMRAPHTACCHMRVCTIYGTGRWHTSCPWLRRLLGSAHPL